MRDIAILSAIVAIAVIIELIKFVRNNPGPGDP